MSSSKKSKKSAKNKIKMILNRQNKQFKLKQKKNQFQYIMKKKIFKVKLFK